MAVQIMADVSGDVSGSSPPHTDFNCMTSLSVKSSSSYPEAKTKRLPTTISKLSIIASFMADEVEISPSDGAASLSSSAISASGAVSTVT